MSAVNGTHQSFGDLQLKENQTNQQKTAKTKQNNQTLQTGEDDIHLSVRNT